MTIPLETMQMARRKSTASTASGAEPRSSGSGSSETVDPGLPLLAPPYSMSPDGIFMEKMSAAGPVTVQLTNFTAKIVADIEWDNGVDSVRHFEVVARPNGSAPGEDLLLFRPSILDRWVGYLRGLVQTPLSSRGPGKMHAEQQSSSSHGRCGTERSSPTRAWRKLETGNGSFFIREVR